jgi:hypothetical protein
MQMGTDILQLELVSPSGKFRKSGIQKLAAFQLINKRVETAEFG